MLSDSLIRTILHNKLVEVANCKLLKIEVVVPNITN